MFLFNTRSFWIDIGVPQKKLKERFEYFFGNEKRLIEDREEALKILLNITTVIQNEMVHRLKQNDSYAMLLKLFYIFDEIHARYIAEKEARLKLVELNIDSPNALDTFILNRNITRNIIDSCNIWAENCILHQHDLKIKNLNVEKEFVMDYDLLLDLYLYGFASQSVSLLMLSKSIGEKNSFYGLEITCNNIAPAEVLKYHPYIYFNTAIVGNQNGLVEVPLTADANQTDFGKGFLQEYHVEFLLFLAAIKYFQDEQLHGDNKALTVISKDMFIQMVECCTNPPIDGKAFYDSFVLTKEKIEQHLRKKEEIIWVVGTNKYRQELRPFTGLDDDNVLVAYGALEQAKQLWVSFFSNGGMCYTNSIPDNLTKAMEKRNKELSDVLVDRIRDILNANYTAKIDLKDVKYQRIFGDMPINYGDYDIVYFTEDSKELFLIESKYFSDSLNSSGMVTDYKKMFEDNGYYDHCRKRYDLVIANPEKIKTFIGATDEISVHMLFLTSKPIEMELQDDDGVVTCLSLNIFEKYIKGKLISGEDDSIVRPVKKI